MCISISDEHKMVHRRGALPLNSAHGGRRRPNQIVRPSRTHLLLLPAVAQLVLITTLFDLSANSTPAGLLIQSLFAFVVVLAFNVAMLLIMLLSLAPPFATEAVSPTAASRFQKAAAVGYVTTLLLATSLFVSVALVGY